LLPLLLPLLLLGISTMSKCFDNGTVTRNLHHRKIRAESAGSKRETVRQLALREGYVARGK
jgi:hypothetical protein